MPRKRKATTVQSRKGPSRSKASNTSAGLPATAARRGRKRRAVDSSSSTNHDSSSTFNPQHANASHNSMDGNAMQFCVPLGDAHTKPPPALTSSSTSSSQQVVEPERKKEMKAIAHHVTFLPILDNIRNSAYNNHTNLLAATSTSASTTTTTATNNTMDPKMNEYDNSILYKLFHPRNLGGLPPVLLDHNNNAKDQSMKKNKKAKVKKTKTHHSTKGTNGPNKGGGGKAGADANSGTIGGGIGNHANSSATATAGSKMNCMTLPSWESLPYHDFYHTFPPRPPTTSNERKKEELKQGATTTTSLQVESGEGSNETLSPSSSVPIQEPSNTTTTSQSTYNNANNNTNTTPTPTTTTRSKDPVLRFCTVLTPHPPTSTIAIGDTAGYVTLYTTIPIIRAIGRIETSASYRSALIEFHDTGGESGGGGGGEERSSGNGSTNTTMTSAKEGNNSTTTTTTTSTTTGIASRVVSSTVDKQNSISALCFTSNGHEIAVGTRWEIELFNVRDNVHGGDGSGSCIWSVNFEKYGMHLCWEWMWMAEEFHRDYVKGTGTTTNTNTNNDGDDDNVGGGSGSSSDWKKANKLKSMIRGPPLRLDAHPSREGGGIIASFGFEGDKTAGIDQLANDTIQEGKELESKCCAPALCFMTGSSRSSSQNHNSNGDVFSDFIPKEAIIEHPLKEQKEDDGTLEGVTWKDVMVGSRSMVIWDKSNPDRVIGVYRITSSSSSSSSTTSTTSTSRAETTTTSQNNNDVMIRQELLLMDFKSRHIIHRTTVPCKVSGSRIITSEAINQSPEGLYTIAASSANGGIRVYQTDGLAHLATYGEGVSLHGHHISWQECFFVKLDDGRYKDFNNLSKASETNNALALNNNNKTNDSKRQLKIETNKIENEDEFVYPEKWGRVIEHTDEVISRGKHEEYRRLERQRQQQRKVSDLIEPNIAEESLKDLYIVSYPNPYLEPVDYKDTIFFWDLSLMSAFGGSKLSSFTMKGPSKSEGITSLLFDDSLPVSQGGRFLISTQRGDCLQLAPKLTSDFPGQMYPMGYLVIDDNIIFIEDEDELDKVVDYVEDFPESSSPRVENDLETALRLSLSEREEDFPIDVVGDDDYDDGMDHHSNMNIAPCLPETYLKDRLRHETDLQRQKELQTNKARNNVIDDTNNTLGDLLNLLPQVDQVNEFIQSQNDRFEKRVNAIDTITIRAIDSIQPSRTRKKQIGPTATMEKSELLSIAKKQEPADGSGTVMYVEESDSNGGKMQCAACLGRSVLHICGKREIPIDHDAIEKAKREKEEEELRKKKELQAEKRKAAEAKRKETRRLKKEEEEKLKKEEEAKLEIKEEEVPHEQSDADDDGDDDDDENQEEADDTEMNPIISHDDNYSHDQQTGFDENERQREIFSNGLGNIHQEGLDHSSSQQYYDARSGGYGTTMYEQGTSTVDSTANTHGNLEPNPETYESQNAYETQGTYENQPQNTYEHPQQNTYETQHPQHPQHSQQNVYENPPQNTYETQNAYENPPKYTYDPQNGYENPPPPVSYESQTYNSGAMQYESLQDNSRKPSTHHFEHQNQYSGVNTQQYQPHQSNLPPPNTYYEGSNGHHEPQIQPHYMESRPLHNDAYQGHYSYPSTNQNSSSATVQYESQNGFNNPSVIPNTYANNAVSRDITGSMGS